MSAYETLTAGYIVLPQGEPIYSEMATTVRLEDEAAGLFVVIEQSGDTSQKISLTAQRARIEALETAMAEEMAENVQLFELLGVMPQIIAGTAGTVAVTEAVKVLKAERDRLKEAAETAASMAGERWLEAQLLLATALRGE